MKRLLILTAAAVLASAEPSRAEGPDDKYIQIYNLIQEGNQYEATGDAAAARERFVEARDGLKRIQTSYPDWNQKLVDYRLRVLEQKLAPPAKPAPAVAPGAAPATNVNTGTVAPAPSRVPPQPAPQVKAPLALAPVNPVPTPPPPQAAPDERDSRIQQLQEQVARLQNDRGVLEAKLREAVAAQPAALDPRELAKAEQRIKGLEKEKEILRVSLVAAESKSREQNDSASTELKKSLAETRQKLSQQNDVIIALRQEKDVLQQRLATTSKPDDSALAALRTENDALRQKLAARPAEAPPANASADKELASTQAALQSSRETVASLQVRLRSLQEERDRMEKTRKDLETKLASAPSPQGTNAAQVKQLQVERDALQKQLNDTHRQLAENNKKGKNKGTSTAPSEDVSALRARLQVLEANKVPYTPEELALFKQPDQPMALVALAEPKPPTKELPDSAAPILAEAQRAMTTRRFDEAEKKYSEVLKMDEKNVATLQRLAAAQLEQNRPKDAEQNLNLALAQNPSDARTLLLLGIAKFDQDKFDEALDSFSKSAQIDPQNPETQNYLGITLSQKGQRAAAETALRKAVQLSPNYKEAHYNLAVVYATQQPPFLELARWHYQKALAFGHPQNPNLEKLLEKKEAQK